MNTALHDRYALRHFRCLNRRLDLRRDFYSSKLQRKKERKFTD